MNMAGALGLGSPTIEGRIVLTAENKTAEGFDAARKQLDEFAKEAAKVQTELNTHKRTVLRQQREHLKDAERVGKISGEMFKNIVETATAAFATLSVMLGHVDETFREMEGDRARRELLIRTTSHITVAAQTAEVKKLARELHLPSLSGAQDLYAGVSSRAADRFETTRRFRTLLNYGAYSKQPGQDPWAAVSELQSEIQQAMRSGRPGALPRLLSKIPGYYSAGSGNNRESDKQYFESMKFMPMEMVEGKFYEKLDAYKNRVPEIGKAWEETNKASEAYNDKQRAITELMEERARTLEPWYKAMAKVEQDMLEAFMGLPGPVKEFTQKMVFLGEAAASVLALLVAFRIAGRAVMFGLRGSVPPAAMLGVAGGGAAATAAKGLVGGGRGLLGGLGKGLLGKAGGLLLSYDIIHAIYKHAQLELVDQVKDDLDDRLPRGGVVLPPGRAKHVIDSGRDLMSPWLQMNRTKDDWQGRSYVLPPSFGGGSGISPINYHPGGGVDGSDRQRSGSTAADATRSVRSFTEAVKYATWTLQRFSNEAGGGLGGGPGGGDGMLGGGYGGPGGGGSEGRRRGGGSGELAGLSSGRGFGAGPGGSERRGGSDSGASTRSFGKLAANQQEAYAAFRELGYDDKTARLAIGNLSGESLRDPGNIHWDRKHTSQGIAQWDPPRSAKIAKEFGAEPRNLSVRDQVRAYDWEMKRDYPKAYAGLHNKDLSDYDRMAAQVYDFEHPLNPRTDTATRMGLYHGLGEFKDAAGAGDAVVVQNNSPYAPSRQNRASSRVGADIAPGAGGGGYPGHHFKAAVGSGSAVVVPTDDIAMHAWRQEQERFNKTNKTGESFDDLVARIDPTGKMRRGGPLPSSSVPDAVDYGLTPWQDRAGADAYQLSKKHPKEFAKLLHPLTPRPGPGRDQWGAPIRPTDIDYRPIPIPHRDPLANVQANQSLHLGRGAVDVNLKLDRQLAAAGPASIYHASNFDLGVNVDRTGHPFSRPGDPAFPPPPTYG